MNFTVSLISTAISPSIGTAFVMLIYYYLFIWILSGDYYLGSRPKVRFQDGYAYAVPSGMTPSNHPIQA
jgi:hypothetical protein